eukprot:TRINITY_DN61666_c0_g1_i1.p2 TRINITY_DN61666_c0_g1~~TRINITY_DN61666_c0_g1_i1.p2  ORF type:complete len:118 (-),score=15.75 TRINITY_DN61666_c0_g1_i1:121-474(-)
MSAKNQGHSTSSSSHQAPFPTSGQVSASSEDPANAQERAYGQEVDELERQRVSHVGQNAGVLEQNVLVLSDAARTFQSRFGRFVSNLGRAAQMIAEDFVDSDFARSCASCAGSQRRL